MERKEFPHLLTRALGWGRTATPGGQWPRQLPGLVAERARFELANRVTPVTAFPVRTPKPPDLGLVWPSTSIRLELDCHSSSTLFNGTPILEMP
jgi:hypothetical protein